MLALNRARHETRRALTAVLALRAEIDTVFAALDTSEADPNIVAVAALLCERRARLTAMVSANREITSVALAGLMSLGRWDALERKAYELRRVIHPIAEDVYGLVIEAKRVIDTLQACLDFEDAAYVELALDLGEPARANARQSLIQTLC